jgi:hypothetical protein
VILLLPTIRLQQVIAIEAFEPTVVVDLEFIEFVKPVLNQPKPVTCNVSVKFSSRQKN